MIAENKSLPTPMGISAERVRTIFEGLERGDGAAFFQHVADDVDWTVMGTHPLAGHYSSKKAFIDGTFAKLGRVLPQGAQLHVEHEEIGESVADFARTHPHSTVPANACHSSQRFGPGPFGR